ncbi:hypothetical protein FJTKL_04928 [Diaporthe vaccinii]|uniref:Uncharacterized protein n=1 Tax=Diaporthe vaccinii TaxID=105482 RepID=A0ABR4DRS0_9PEZI
MDTENQGNDYFPEDWTSLWSQEQAQDHSFLHITPSAPSDTPVISDVTPVPQTTNNSIKDDDVRSLLIMICSRLDKIEATNAQANKTLDDIGLSVGHIGMGLETLKKMVDSLKSGMSSFSKALFSFLRGG